MAKAWASAAALGFVLATGCSDASSGFHTIAQRSDRTEPDEPVGYGWFRPISTTNFDAAAAIRLGEADSTLAGSSLRSIVTSETVRVRADNRACTSCHEWAAGMTRKAFCVRIPAFVALPTSHGDRTDPESAKPLVLKDLLQRWYQDDCPD